jgi:AcrR family transcriptional regulator
MVEPKDPSEKLPPPHLPDKLRDRLYPVVLDLFSRNDFHQVNMREICQISGLSLSTVYKYFPSKEALLFTILDQKISEIGELLRVHLEGLESTKEIFRKIFWVTMDYYDKNPGVAITAFITVPMRSWMREASYRRNDAHEIMKTVTLHGHERKEIDPNLGPGRMMDLYFMFCHRQIQLWYYHRMKWKLVDTIPRFFDLFWKSVSPDCPKGDREANP